ncbi:uncharacterized protein LOC124545591 [Schistocerca americana]|uniref:uncharacterized protein LOC124545591 n=1 Tax=Schistocerca americana TaxID=7009 RepID=UPI001F500BC0|nr:uncharacterized protein LOC124545591 [Schistocerca americana]
MRMLRRMCGVTRNDRNRNEFVRGAVKVGPTGKEIQESRLRWYGHLQRKGEECIGNRVEDIEGAGRRGRPKMRWKDKISSDLMEKGWKKEEAMDEYYGGEGSRRAKPTLRDVGQGDDEEEED